MRFLVFMSEYMVPLVIFYIVGFGVLAGRPVYDDFLKGAENGLKTVIGMMPTLIGLMVGIGVLRASGFLEAVSAVLAIPASWFHIPTQVIPVALIRLISNSAAIGLVLDLFKTYGPDSYIGLIVSIMMGCTETIFYTMSVYFMSVGIRKTRWTLAGALIATLAGVMASILLAGILK